MKLCVLVLVGLIALVYSQKSRQPFKVADKTFLEKQKQILQLFSHINQPSHYKEHIEIAKSFTFEGYADHYTKPEVVKHFQQYLKYNILPKGNIFSIFYKKHLDQAEALFKVFYYANDFDIFYKTAVWARQHINEGMFLYALSVAVIHRPDTYGIILPPIYEVYPHYFFNSEVIHEAYKMKQIHHALETQRDHEDGRHKFYTVAANYSGHYLNLHPEQSLSYYLEDIGINSFYYYYNLHYPFWMCEQEFNLKNDKRGELYYFVHQQLLARYYLERISNGFGEIPFFNWELPLDTPYTSSLVYSNGLEFPNRPNHARLQEYFYNYGQSWTTKGPYGYSYTIVRDFERRINDAIDSGFMLTQEGQIKKITPDNGADMLGRMIAYNHDSPHSNFYGAIDVFARHLLGYSYQPLDSHHVVPSALEHFETSMRDPVFYQYYKKIIGKFQRYQMHLPPYTQQDLEFPGVKVVKFEVDSLVTYFDYFYSDISNAVYDSEEEFEHDTFHIRAKQYRLNHKPFTYKITVKSDKDIKGSVKVFLGPKYDEYGRYINISHNRMNMLELDHFEYDLQSGDNIITKSSYDTTCYGPDRTSFYELQKQVEEAYNGQQEFHIDGKQNYMHFPKRYMLPKGSHDGTAFQFYVFVYPFKPYNGKDHEIGEYYYPKVGSGAQYVDGYPLGYPFDRFITFDEMWYEIPNSYFHEAKIYHKHAEEINAPYH